MEALIVKHDKDDKGKFLYTSLVYTEDFHKFYWGPHYPSHCFMEQGEYELIRNCGSFNPEDPSDDEQLDEWEAEFYLEFRVPVAAMKAAYGIMAPDGTFYPCHYGSHEDLVVELTVQKLRHMPTNGEIDKAMAGYLVIADQVATMEGDTEPTALQAETVKQLLALCNGKTPTGIKEGLESAVIICKDAVLKSEVLVKELKDAHAEWHATALTQMLLVAMYGERLMDTATFIEKSKWMQHDESNAAARMKQAMRLLHRSDPMALENSLSEMGIDSYDYEKKQQERQKK